MDIHGCKLASNPTVAARVVSEAHKIYTYGLFGLGVEGGVEKAKLNAFS